MTKAESRALFLRHLDLATRQGQPLSGGTAADLSDRHDHLIGQAIADLGAALRPEAVWDIAPQEGLQVGGYRLCALPEDFVALCALVSAEDGQPVEDYVLLPDRLRLPGSLSRPLKARYVRRPAPLLPDAEDDALIDLPEEAVHLAPLRCAVLATAAGDPDISAWLQALYTQSLSALVRPRLLDRPRVEMRYQMEV
jgi:hypothetical protein